MYLGYAKLEAFNEGKSVGLVTYEAPNTLGSSKFSKAEERIFSMLDILFGKISALDATKAITDPQG